MTMFRITNRCVTERTVSCHTWLKEYKQDKGVILHPGESAVFSEAPWVWTGTYWYHYELVHLHSWVRHYAA